MPSLTQNGTTIDLLFLKGQVEPSKLEVETITREGVDGVAFRRVARRPEPFEMLAIVDCLDAITAYGVYKSVCDWQGSLIGFVDDYGGVSSDDDNNPTEDAMLLKVGGMDRKPIISPVGGINPNSTILLKFKIVLQRTLLPTT